MNRFICVWIHTTYYLNIVPIEIQILDNLISMNCYSPIVTNKSSRVCLSIMSLFELLASKSYHLPSSAATTPISEFAIQTAVVYGGKNNSNVHFEIRFTISFITCLVVEKIRKKYNFAGMLFASKAKINVF